jgi:hypothetical protein
MLRSIVTRTRRALPALALLALPVAARPASAQGSDVLLRLRSGAPLGNRFVVDSGGGLVATGNIAYGIIPASGKGERMMWHPYKVAFRAGGVSGAAWDDANVGYYSWAGGQDTQANGVFAFAFGQSVIASGSHATALGSNTVVSGGGGFGAGRATCSGTWCVAVGGYATASKQGAAAIGYRVTASGDYSLALGHRASTNGKIGAVVIGDASSSTDSLLASANNQFSLRAAGGVRLFTNAAKTAGVTLAAGGSSWNVVSDRNRKADFTDVDGEAILAALRTVPVSTWRYRDEADRTVRHIGPMAQDWHRAFPLNGDARTINMSDFDGVNLAAVRALEARTAELRAKANEVRALRDEVARLRTAQAAMETRLERLEAAARR